MPIYTRLAPASPLTCWQRPAAAPLPLLRGQGDDGDAAAVQQGTAVQLGAARQLSVHSGRQVGGQRLPLAEAPDAAGQLLGLQEVTATGTRVGKSASGRHVIALPEGRSTEQAQALRAHLS